MAIFLNQYWVRALFEWLVERDSITEITEIQISLGYQKPNAWTVLESFVSADIVCYIFNSPVLLSRLADHFSLFCGPLLLSFCWFHCRVDAHICDIIVLLYISITIIFFVTCSLNFLCMLHTSLQILHLFSMYTKAVYTKLVYTKAVYTNLE